MNKIVVIYLDFWELAFIDTSILKQLTKIIYSNVIAATSSSVSNYFYLNRYVQSVQMDKLSKYKRLNESFSNAIF